MNEPNPTGRRRLAHQFPAFVGSPAVLTPPVTVPSPPVYPHRLRGRPARAHEIPFLFKPGKFITPVTPLTPAIGAPAAGTFLLSLEPGTKVTYAWSTSIVTSYSGLEQRESPFGQPRRRVEGAAFLLDGADRDAKGTLMRSAARGSAFLLALPFEELPITADSLGTVVTVGDTSGCDWALAGQRCLVVSVDGDSSARAVVQSTTATTITIALVDSSDNFTFGSIGATGRAGGRIMPLTAVVLDATQGFARYPVTVDLWTVRALATEFGFGGADSMGVGASILTVNDGEYIPVAELTDDDLMIWDRPNLQEETSSEAMASRADVVDLGALVFALGGADTPDWGRSIRYASSSPAEAQWIKAFLRRARGRQVAFLLPSNRPDLVFDSLTSGGFKVKSASVAGGGDYASWFVSQAFRRLAVTTTTGVVYATITAVTDNHDGTLTLATTATIGGTVTKVSLLEQVRFDSDELPLEWDGGTFSFEAGVVTVQDVIPAPPRQSFVFDTVVTLASFTFPISPPKEIAADLGQTTLLLFSSDRTINFGSIRNTLPAGNVDNAVVCVCNVNNSSFGMQAVHEDTTWTASTRLLNPGLTTIIGTRNAIWYRYNASLQRWVFMRTSSTL